MLIEDYGSVPPERGLALENHALRALARAPANPRLSPAGAGGRATLGLCDRRSGARTAEQLLVWESAWPAVVLPRRGDPHLWVRASACAGRGVPMLYRDSGGGAVVVGLGCLCFAVILSLDARPGLADVAYSYEWLLAREARALAMPGIATRSTDLALRDRKFAGHAQRRVCGALLHHGVLLYNFDLALIECVLAEPLRAPAWRRARSHREFLTNAPLTRSDAVRRLRRLPTALEH